MGLSGNVFVTGGSGTLGRAIVTLAQREGWHARFTIYSRSEALQASMRARFPECRYVLGDVRDYRRLEAAIAGHETVIHAAAMKQIPACEQNPSECWKTNVLGTEHVTKACARQGVVRAVAISTDKACRAITMYGLSKLAMENVVRIANGTEWHLVRYGNVVASRGSVIPVWQGQRDRGDPLTVTDPTMTRFWMSPMDAAKLVVAALETPVGSILVPKLNAMSIERMAHGIGAGAGLKVSGRRSLEKQHEDLVHTDEPTQELGNGFLIHTGGTLGHHYRSDEAPPLCVEQFMAMLAEAEALE